MVPGFGVPASTRGRDLFLPEGLKNELCSQLQDSSVVRHRRPQIWICRCTCRIPGELFAPKQLRVLFDSRTGYSGCGSTVPAQPCVFNMVEDVESFGAKFESPYSP